MFVYMWADGCWCEIDDLYLHRDREQPMGLMTIGQANVYLDQLVEDMFPTIH